VSQVFAIRASKKAAVLFHALCNFVRYVHNTKHVLEPRVLCTWINQMTKSKLSATMQTLKPGCMQKLHFLWKKLDIAVQIVADYFHESHSGQVQSGDVGLSCTGKYTTLLAKK